MSLDQAAHRLTSLTRLRRLIDNAEKELEALNHAIQSYENSPGRMLPQLGNAHYSATQVATSMRVALRTIEELTR